MALPNLVSSYIGPQLMAQGITQGAGALSDALRQYEEDKARAAMGDITIDYAKNIPGAISPEALQRYHQANAKEKAYIALGVQSNLKNMLESQQQEWQKRMYAAHANYYLRQAAAEPESARFELSPEEAAAYAQAGKVPLRTSAKSFQVAESGDQVDTDTAGNPIYSQDKSMYRQGGKWKPVTEAMRKAIEDFEASKQAQEAAKQTQQKPGFFSRLFGGGAATPTPTPAPAATPGAQPARGTVAGGGAQSAAAIKAAFRAGQLSREEAVKQLQAIGFQ